jgi:hypothetical protein
VKNLQTNLESLGLYSKYKQRFLFLSKLKCLTYDLETSYVPFSENKPFGKTMPSHRQASIQSKFEILCGGLSCYMSITRMLEFINLYIPNYAARYNKNTNRLNWVFIETLLEKKLKMGAALYNVEIDSLIREETNPFVFLPDNLEMFFNIMITLGRLIEVIHCILLFPLLHNLRTLIGGSKKGRGIYSTLAYKLPSWSKSTELFAFNGASFDNICMYKLNNNWGGAQNLIGSYMYIVYFSDFS